MKTRPLKLVLARTYGNEAAWSMWKLVRGQYTLFDRSGQGQVARWHGELSIYRQGKGWAWDHDAEGSIQMWSGLVNCCRLY